MRGTRTAPAQKDKFELQIIAMGAFVDSNSNPGKSYLIETMVVRLNWVALNAWLLSITSNSRDCYKTQEEWDAHRVFMGKKHDAVKARIIELLGIGPVGSGSVCITQSQAEVFTVVHIWEVLA